ncbi:MULTISPECIES: TetR/AcrR family transcriptional regulator C-terminal domain-containing protein [Brevibacterium]|uniref:TetR/AcrR family transcriptional regulator C-terminal domain-containing protein n=1 Tax=Brevibacterium casei TaxID=33889 RepID=A0A7T3ZZR0_9MICO|nr:MULTISPECIES: TetR/AcrR family transcriptional regulator C-terminal domain-containing protein [Brevibacterium]QQB14681.1 TetR/AcrR family transcriptional regulator C-terminal domain-containing protein [Brevibacterium casei]
MNSSRPSGRRPKSDSLTRSAIVAAAIDLLDEAGEPGLTVRALAARLHTGPGSIYWHVGDRSGLLALACDAVLAAAAEEAGSAGESGVAGEGGSAPTPEPIAAVRGIAVSLFDALDAHPWAGVILAGAASAPSLLTALDRIGTLLDEAGVARDAQFYQATAILNYVLGVAAQMARNARSAAGGKSQAEWLEKRAAEWEQMDDRTHPFLHRVSADFRDHDDREQFIAGLDLLLAGIVASVPGSSLERSANGSRPAPQ